MLTRENRHPKKTEQKLLVLLLERNINHVLVYVFLGFFLYVHITEKTPAFCCVAGP